MPEQAALTSVSLDDGGLSHPATSITAPTPVTIPATGTSGVAGPYPSSLVVSGFQGTVGRIMVRLNNLSHTRPDDLDILLVGPAGQKVILMSDTGGGFAIEHVDLTFRDDASRLPDETQIVSGSYVATDFENTAVQSLPAPAPAAPYSQTLNAFTGVSPNGTWSLYVSDDSGGNVGALYGFTLIITPQFDNTTPLPVPPTGTSGVSESSLVVSGLTAPITRVTVSLHITHPFDADLDISLIGPDGTIVDLSSDNGAAGDNYGGNCIGNRTTFDDNEAFPLITTGTAPFTPYFRPEEPLSAFNGKSGGAANGTWKLRIVDDTLNDSGILQCWSVTIAQDDNAVVQPPTALTATSVAGNQVTLRWAAPGAGPAPTNYLLEGGVNPGETLASLPTGGTNPILTFAAPTGAFYVRLRAQAGAALSDVSNEIRLLVNVPLPPSAPAQFQGVRSGSLVGLAWRNTFEGGAPTSFILDVTGAAVASIPLPLTDSISFSGVPDGSYTLRLRAVNASGASLPSNPVDFEFPDTCSGAPERPFNFLAYRIGNALYVVWEPNPSGAAATGFVVNVTGAFTGSFPVVARSVSGTVGPGTYNFSVAATNLCGTSVPTVVRSVSIP